MKQILYQNSAGEFIALHQVVMFNIEASGVDEQQRHEIYATTADGKRHLLASALGTESQMRAQSWLGALLDAAGFERAVAEPLT